MGKRTPLYQAHISAQAKLVDFSGWDLPVHYGSQIEEHHAVRNDAGVFDVSHMTVLEVTGTAATDYLDRLLANNIRKAKLPGQAIYSAMLNEDGGILDDLIVYSHSRPGKFLLVVNCATREKDLAWMRQQCHAFGSEMTGSEMTGSEMTGSEVSGSEAPDSEMTGSEMPACKITECPDYAILAVQGPKAIEKTQRVLSAAQREATAQLRIFQGSWAEGWFIAKTGYTGESGVEIILPGEDAPGFWDKLVAAGVRPVGLGARDTLRLEAGMNLYGSDMDESVSPMESNMASTVVLPARDFIGAVALRTQLEKGKLRELVGLVMHHKGVLRAQYPVFCDDERVGEVTSGAFSPTLGHSIALARVSRTSSNMTVTIRGKMQPVEWVRPPFIRRGKRG